MYSEDANVLFLTNIYQPFSPLCKMFSFEMYITFCSVLSQKMTFSQPLYIGIGNVTEHIMLVRGVCYVIKLHCV